MLSLALNDKFTRSFSSDISKGPAIFRKENNNIFNISLPTPLKLMSNHIL